MKLQFGTAGEVAKRVADGAPGDVVIVNDAGLASLAKADKVVASSIGRRGMGVGVAGPGRCAS